MSTACELCEHAEARYCKTHRVVFAVGAARNCPAGARDAALRLAINLLAAASEEAMGGEPGPFGPDGGTWRGWREFWDRSRVVGAACRAMMAEKQTEGSDGHNE